MDELRTLLGRCGGGPFLASPILLPTPRDFPDIWLKDVDSCERIALRLLKSAGLSSLRARVAGFRQVWDPNEQREGASMHKDTVAWFAGVDASRRALFGVDEDILDDPVKIVGALCHEVAHAYRHVHCLVTRSNDDEERRTDLTTVFLGFGALTTNAAYQYRVHGQDDGARPTVRWEHSKLGYLPDEEMSFLLGVQLALRGDRRETAEVCSHIGANQRADIEAALRLFQDRRPILDALQLSESDIELYRGGPRSRQQSIWQRLIQFLRRRKPEADDDFIEAQAAIRRALRQSDEPDSIPEA